MKKKSEVAVFWFRRDLRLEDNAGLFHALKSGYPVLPVFMFDRTILSRLDNTTDRRVDFIHQAVGFLKEKLRILESDIFAKYGYCNDIWNYLLEEFTIKEVYANHDYEPYALKRDQQTGHMLNEKGIPFYTFKDQVIFEKNEILTGSNKPYTVFTPYSKRWKETLNDFYLKPYPAERYSASFFKVSGLPFPSLEEIGFKPADIRFAPPEFPEKIILNYNESRDIPSVYGTSRLGVHLRFGTISIRSLASAGNELSEKWLNELIWREFYMSILWHFPHVGEGKSFRQEYDMIPWQNNMGWFERWCHGNTGFPMVDAGMRELNTTGFMHNRLRMITASFLCKDLLIDWRWGEAWFASKLLDFDLSANNGGWQWAAGSGCDAAPYFRIFNPVSQTLKFDPKLDYIKRWVPELGTPDYPLPVVDHKAAREKTLAVYRKALER